MNGSHRSGFVAQALRQGRLHDIAQWVREHSRMAARVRGGAVEIAQAYRTPEGADAMRFEEVSTFDEAREVVESQAALCILGPGGDYVQEVR